MNKIASSRFVSSTSCRNLSSSALETSGNQAYLFKFDEGEVRLATACH